jgi:hypothetical protein
VRRKIIKFADALMRLSPFLRFLARLGALTAVVVPYYLFSRAWVSDGAIREMLDFLVVFPFISLAFYIFDKEI